MRIVISLLSGMIFGLGLTISQMVNPAIVRGFLDIRGTWNPSLIFVLGSAVSISLIAWRLRNYLAAPISGGSFPMDASTRVDYRLLLGAMIFGIGWGLVGICPGPAIVGISIGSKQIFIFVLAMVAGMFIYRHINWLIKSKFLNNS